MLLERSFPDPSHLAGLDYTTRQLAPLDHARHPVVGHGAGFSLPAGQADTGWGRPFWGLTLDIGVGYWDDITLAYRRVSIPRLSSKDSSVPGQVTAATTSSLFRHNGFMFDRWLYGVIYVFI